MENGGGDHKTGVDGASNDTAEGIPGPVIKPVVEGVVAGFGEVFGCAVVEVGVKLVDYGFIAED